MERGKEFCCEAGISEWGKRDGKTRIQMKEENEFQEQLLACG